jgi:hypothetical protein
MQATNFMQQYLNVPNILNYKNVKCFYFERDNYCKYGKNCQYAHSDSDIKSATEISYLNSIATAMNYQMNMAYGDSGNNSLEETQNRVNIYMQSIMNNNAQNNNTYVNNVYDYSNYDNNNTGNSYENNYDYSYTPDTNYGDSSSNNNNYYNECSNNYNQYAQYGDYSQYNYGYTGNLTSESQNFYNLDNSYRNTQGINKDLKGN